ncbi:MAG: hypothetical protein PWQ57_2608 [Desulfovibrionales bacterium]|jgi:hypothetical protein|nr:hypothetical protein [Desulfovibrionales bacterium]
MLSHELEDIIAVLDGRAEIVEDVSQAREDIRAYLAAEFARLLADVDFQDSLPVTSPETRPAR